jgi:hypothetical protein
MTFVFSRFVPNPAMLYLDAQKTLPKDVLA